MSAYSEHVRRQWFVAARAEHIRSVPRRVMVLDSPVVLVRDRRGVILAFEDRCPHRGAPLSAGRLGPKGLVCAYHGWTFGTEGRCLEMPGTLDSKPCVNLRVPSFHVIERDGLVWLSRADTSPLPQRITALDPAQRRFVWQTRWAAPILEAQENFLDALHTHTVHPGLVRRDKVRRPVDVELCVDGDGFHVDYMGQPEQSGLFFRLFESPRTRERAYFSALSVAQLEYRYASGWAVWITLCFTPETPRTTHVFATLHLEGRWAPGWLVRTIVGPFLRHIARQDRWMLELQERERQHFPTRRPVITALDVVRPYLDEAWAGRDPMLPALQKLTLYL